MKAIFVFVSFIALLGRVSAEDWPTYQHDNRRSAVTGETLELPLEMRWHYRSAIPPQTAWTSPAKWDAFTGNEGLQSMRNFDPAFFVTAVSEDVYFGSSVDNAAHCLDAESGVELWVHFTNSAVRLPPTIAQGRAWFGSDDGHAYCVDAENGELIWKYKPSPDPRLIPSNGKLISPWPVRSTILVKDGIAYFAASLLPWESSYLCAVMALDSAASGPGTFITEVTGVTLQGALLASSQTLYAPQGRSAPLVFRRESGAPLGEIAGSGGVYCVLTEDEQFVSMPSSQKEKEDTIRIADGKPGGVLLSFSGANRMIVSGRHAYFHQGTKLKVIDRVKLAEIQRTIDALQSANQARAEQKKKASANDAARIAVWDAETEATNGQIAAWEARKQECELWAREASIPIGFILAGTTLFVGGEESVSAYNAQTGAELWTTTVDGKAYGLAAADGRLFVSTDRGSIYCFQ